MLGQSSHTAPPRRGGITIYFALCLVGLVGVVAIAVDGGLLLDNHQRVQAAADAAALAAAVDLYENYPTNEGVDSSGTAKASALNTAAKLTYTNDGSSSVVTVNIPPQFGPHAGRAGFAEVMVQYNQPRYFSGLFGASSLPVRARSVARGRWVSFKNGIIVLDLVQSESLKANGTGAISVTNADIIVNSSDDQAVGGDGQGSTLKVVNGTFQLSGGTKSNTVLDGPVQYNQKPTPDPLAYLPQPTLPASAQTVRSANVNSAEAKLYLDALNIKPKDVGQLYILEPGRYDRLPNFTNGDVVIMKQASANSSNGIYYLNNSGFTSTGATIVMDPTGGTTGGFMLYNDPQQSSAGISITGGRVVMDPLTDGKYQGISIFQRRDADVPLQISGQGGMSISGTFYVAGGAIKITGSDSSNLDVIGAQYISRTLQTGGNGGYRVDWNPDKTARLRQIGLVE